MNAMEFFQQSAGRWKSSRVTHHLAFKRSETGESEILVETLAADDPEIIELCQMHNIDPTLSIGGSRVRWLGTMAWDREGEENHEGKTVFAIVPDADNARQGKLLRERGYAEIMPVVGRFHLDEEDGLVLTTDYETMSSIERFWFSGTNMRMRTSTVKRFGGFSTASYCVESRIDAEIEGVSVETVSATPQLASVLGW
ncbi:phycobiliprotein lyase [Calothrix sp. UHCC 0171]|uniref:phycobiliprotein lyase n=1 Tax=Calothrix sp. UHCC 0171 TaxID=3110245 RepID=UPI002B21EA61|nr:phycobiliprotein lyase [Calothrix sp. UHCC 0171]MEA5570836.1 phycobiliprotein lyase [Calothrix sp. UHCC 0171]